MLNSVESLLVPSSLLRIRQFMTQSGLKVRPWATPAETLEAFDRLLEERKSSSAFWSGLEGLLAALTRDLECRLSNPESAVRNEVLDPKEHGRLLAELRAALQSRSSPGFQSLASRLSRPALGALCIMAAVALSGCGGEASGNPKQGPSAAGGTQSWGGSAAGGTSGGASAGGTTPGAGGANTGGTVIVFATGGSSATGSGGSPDCDRSIAEALEACDLTPAYREELLKCVDQLNDSWQAGVRQILACGSCLELQRQLSCLERSCADPGLSEKFSLEEFVDHCVVALYRGVAFE